MRFKENKEKILNAELNKIIMNKHENEKNFIT